jgi:DNA-directed RNA polymerase beta subunit
MPKAKGETGVTPPALPAMTTPTMYRNLLELYYAQNNGRQIVDHQIASFNHFMSVEVQQTILRSCPIRVTGSPDLSLTGTTRAAAGTAGTAIRVSVEGAEDGPTPINSTKPGGPLLTAAAPEAGAPPPREVEVCVEFANVQIRKPTIFENNGAVTPMYPNDARLRNMTYAAPVYTDIIATYTMRVPKVSAASGSVEPEMETIVRRRTLPHVHVGKIPVMVGSNFCLLYDTPEKTPRELGECEIDVGGYFIIQGGERVVISQERMSENVPFVFRNNKARGKEVEVIDVKSIGPDNEGAPKSLSVKVVQHAKGSIVPEHIIVTCPRIKAEIPLFVMLRALGLGSDRDIIELICGSVDESPYMMIFQECIEAAAGITTQAAAHDWLAANIGSGGGSRESYMANTLQSAKPPRTATVKEILAEECLPHIGGADMLYEKACYIAFITKKVLDVFTGAISHDDRDAYPNKKVELPGNLMGNLFRYLFGTKVVKDMKTSLTKEIHNGFWKSSGKIEDIINPSNIYKILKSTIVTIGMKSSLATGNFNGGKMGIKQGISQVMNRLTYLSGLSHLRRVSTPIEKTGKLLAPRKLHATQWGFVCPAETPEGHAVGVVKNLSSTALISLPFSPEPIVSFLYDIVGMVNLDSVSRSDLFRYTRVLINGAWIGVLPVDASGSVVAVERLRAAKRSGRIHIHTGITYRVARHEIWINTEGGRLMRPVLNAPAMREMRVMPKEELPAWLTCSATSAPVTYNWTDVLRWTSPAGNSLIEYIDPTETENFYIAMDTASLTPDHSHMEIHPCLVLGTMASNIPFPDHNQSPRNAYQCLSVDETVRMADGVERRIADVRVGDEVQVFDPKTLEMTTARVCHHYVRDTDKRICKLQIAGGRTITATEDHRFMTNMGWVEVKDLIPGKHMIAVSSDPTPLSHTADTASSVILTRDGFLAAVAAAGVHESMRIGHADALEAAGILPLNATDARLPILARICGLVFTDGSLNVFQKRKTVAGKLYEYSLPQFQAHMGSMTGVERLETDIAALSMPRVSVRESHRSFNGATYHTWFVQHNGPLPSLLIALGAQTGKKTETLRSPIPAWILSGSRMVKREFLGGFQGGDGCKFRANVIGSYVNIACNTTSQQTTPVLAPQLRAFFEQMVGLFAEFGVEARVLPNKVMSDSRTEVRYIFQASRVNLLRFWDTIGFRYDTHKQAETAILAELIRELGPDTTILPHEYEKWVSTCYAQGAAVFIPLKTVTDTPNCQISDITVLHDHHSFVTSHGIFSSNCAMGKQAMGVYALNYRERLDTMANILWYSSVPLVSPYMSRFYRAQSMPSGFNVVVAIMTYGGYNQEDSVMINRASLDRGLFRSEFYRTYKDEEKKNQASGEEERFCRPDPAVTRQMKRACYDKLGPDGIVPENTYVTHDDVLIGKVAPIRLRGADGAAQAGINHASLQAMSSVAAAAAVKAAGGKCFRDASKQLRTNETGYVDRIYKGRNGEGYSFVKIRVREERVPVIGDKFASRHGQKGTCGMILEPEDMPQTADGIVPDIIINPHCIPSRMTIAHLMETLLGRAGCELGFLGDATPFNAAMTVDNIAALLQKSGVEPHSNEVLYCGYTGKQMPTSIFMGPIFYQRLKHMVAYKIHCLTPDHEVLTTSGWKAIDKVTTADKVATLQDGKLHYEHPIRTYEYDYAGEMYEIQTQQLSLKVTPNHRMWVATPHTRKRVWEYDFHEAQDILGKHVRYQKDCEWEADEFQFELPGVDVAITRKVDMDAWLTFFGIWMAEGWSNTNKVGLAVNKERVKDALSDAMTKLEISYNYYPATEKLETTDHSLRAYLTPLSVGATKKYLPDWVWSLSSAQAKILLAGMLLGDGHTTASGSEIYSTASRLLADDVQRLAFHAGWSANIRLHTSAGSEYTIGDHSGVTTADLLSVRIIKAKNRPAVNHSHTHKQFAQTETVSDYDGKVYCLEVPGNVFYVRRHGLPVWTGNSRAKGPLVMLTRQPAEGRAREGGLRFGEMERDCMVAHGASAFLKERMLEASDNFEVHVCKGCGLIAVANKLRNFWKCTGCGNTTEFSQVRIPYAYKLFLQELESMNISSRILPETRLRSLADAGGGR